MPRAMPKGMAMPIEMAAVYSRVAMGVRCQLAVMIAPTAVNSRLQRAVAVRRFRLVGGVCVCCWAGMASEYAGCVALGNGWAVYVAGRGRAQGSAWPVGDRLTDALGRGKLQMLGHRCGESAGELNQQLGCGLGQGG